MVAGAAPGAPRAEGPACSTVSGEAHIRGLVTSRPLFVAGLAIFKRAPPGQGEAGLPIARVRGPVDGDVAAFVGARVRPGSRRREICGVVFLSVECGGLPAECGERAGARDRDGAGVFTATLYRGVSSVRGGVAVRARRSARPWGPGRPGERRCPPRQRDGDGSGARPRRVACARAAGRSFDLSPARACLSEVYSLGTIPRKPEEQARLGEPLEAADLGAQPGRRERVDSAEAAQPRDRLRVTGRGDCLLEHTGQRLAALREAPPRLAQSSTNVTRESASSKVRLRSQRPYGCVHARPAYRSPRRSKNFDRR